MREKWSDVMPEMPYLAVLAALAIVAALVVVGLCVGLGRVVGAPALARGDRGGLTDRGRGVVV